MKKSLWLLAVLCFTLWKPHTSFAANKNSVFLGGEYHYNMNLLQTFQGPLSSLVDFKDTDNDVFKYTGKHLNGGHSGGFYVGFETRKDGSWIAMLNTFTFGNVPGFSGQHKDGSKSTSVDFQYFQLTYEIAMRAYLGLEYLFFDFGFRLGVQFNTGDGISSNEDFNNPLDSIPGQANILPALHFTFALGAKYPVLEWLSLQAIFHTAFGVGLFNATEIGFRLGLSFDNIW